MISNSPQASPEAADGTYDVVIRNGLFFDGSDRRATVSDLAISDGKVKSSGQKLAGQGRREIDAQGCWVLPGLLDIHTHYDAEIEAMPGPR